LLHLQLQRIFCYVLDTRKYLSNNKSRPLLP
jgi:hypothetical protein